MKRQIKRLCITVLATLSAVLNLQNQAQSAEVGTGTGTDFLAAVKENFPRWDLDQDGRLSGEEILKAFQNPNVKGRAAAAIIVLESFERTHKGHGEPLESFTLEQIGHLDERLDNHGHRKNTEKAFASSLKKIDVAVPQLYANGVPQIDKIAQGGANDCYFLSVLGGLVQQRPNDLVRMIETNRDGTYTVHFFQHAPITVTCPTTAEISAFNTDSSDGLWFPVLVKAFGRFKLEKHWNEPTLAPRNEVDPLEAAAIKGGLTKQVIALLTGHAVRSFKPANIEDELRGKLLRAFAEHRLVTVSVPGHAMTGLAYDKESDRVQIWNPWGSNGMYKEFGVKMTHGMMWVPIPVLTERSSQIVFEQNADAAPNAAVGHPHKRNRPNRA